MTFRRNPGLEVYALHGAPGVYSARYVGGNGDGNDVRNYEKLLSKLKTYTPSGLFLRFDI